ncbi:hypothetical protein [Psychrobacillus sp. FSL K6-1464]|uniref:hypothetical protein n=1 Tax=Psychrobacillus sp. FSL K6-1464 TaxID=2921545 RepID=UPI0030F828EA
MKTVKNKNQQSSKNVLSNTLMTSTLAASLFLSGVTGAIGTIASNNGIVGELFATTQAEAAGVFAGGKGTVAEPYLIEDKNQLNQMRNYLTSHFKLMDDIDLSGVSWSPVGINGTINTDTSKAFGGSFDGSGHTITGMTINSGSSEIAGFFGFTYNATIKNVKIKNANVTLSAVKNGGILIGKMSFGTVANVSVEGTIIGTSVTQLGGVVGLGHNAIIEKSSFVGDLTAVGAPYGQSVGGVVGSLIPMGTNYHAPIKLLESYANVNIKTTGSEAAIGGLVGTIYGNADSYKYTRQSEAHLKNSFSSGTLESNGGKAIGGIVGQVINSPELENLVSTMKITSINNKQDVAIGGVIGRFDTGRFPATLKNIYALNEGIVSGDVNKSFVGLVLGKSNSTVADISNIFFPANLKHTGQQQYATDLISTEALLNGEAFKQLTNTSMWKLDSQTGLPFLANNPHPLGTNTLNLENSPTYKKDNKVIFSLISNYESFNEIKNGLSNHYILNSDIDLTSRTWTPIGDTNKGSYDQLNFTGSLEGNNHEIKGLKINNTSGTPTGLFGNITNGSVKNLRLTDFDISGINYVGMLTGILTSSNVENVKGKGKVYANGDFVGGLIGSWSGNSNSNLKKMQAESEVTGKNHVGGLVGMMSNGSIVESYSKGSVKGLSGGANVGGLVGASSTTLLKVYSDSTVNSAGSNVGGLVGSIQGGMIADAYSTGAVSGTKFVGGIAGIMYSSTNSTVENLYTTSKVKGTSDYVGGLTGNVSNNKILVKNAFLMNPEVIGGNLSLTGRVAGNNTGNLTSISLLNTTKTNGHSNYKTEELPVSQFLNKATYSFKGFDFGEFDDIPVWAIKEGTTLPYLTFSPSKMSHSEQTGEWSSYDEEANFLIEAANKSVEKAENSKLQADVDAARTLVKALPSQTEKTILTNRLNTVQKEIDDAKGMAEQFDTATVAVVKAEGSKLQVDVNAALSLLNLLPQGTDKTSLTERLNAVQSQINASDLLHQELMTELEEMKLYLYSVEGTREDILALRDALNDILDSSKSLFNKSHQTEVANYVQNILDIINLLEMIWNKISIGELAGLDELVSQLPDSALKDNTQQEVEEAKVIKPEPQTDLAIAILSVEKAESTKLQADVEASRLLVNALPTGKDKTSLIERLNVVQGDNEQVLVEQIAQATAAVVKAENSKLQTDVNDARTLVFALPNGEEKLSLTKRLEIIELGNDDTVLLKEAKNAVNNLGYNPTKVELDAAKELVSKLPNSTDKTELLDSIAEIELKQKASNAVAQAEKMQTNYNITLAEKAINLLPDGPFKTELMERIQQLKLSLDAESKVKSAELTKREPYITVAVTSINKLKDSTKKSELLSRMKGIQDALAVEAEAALLEEATTYVVLAELHKREPYLSQAKDIVSKLQTSTEKTALETRLKAIQDATPVVPEAPAVDPALLKNAETQVSYAERYQRDPYLTRAQEAIDKLPNGEMKSGLQARLDELLGDANDKIEVVKQEAASKSVIKAETASDLNVIEEARLLVNGLKNGVAKTALQDRLEAIEVTEFMQFAYDLKVEIDSVSDSTIKQALQDAYAAVGAAKDRQTGTYMTKASTSIKALSKYNTTHQPVIENLLVFFTDMQKELEVQKLIVAADKAVELSEKYQRATYYTKAQAAIDSLPDGKAKADLQARLDAVTN